MRRSLRPLLAFLTFAAAGAGARAQTTLTADAIIARYAERIGGLDRIHAIQSVRRTGKFYGGGGFEAEVAYENKRPNKVREELTFGGMTGATSFDGKNGWKIEPWAGKKDAETLGEDELYGSSEDADCDDPLLGYRQRGT